jgi:hypothetical protein
VKVITADSPALRAGLSELSAIVGGVVSNRSLSRTVPDANAPPSFGTFAAEDSTWVQRVYDSVVSIVVSLAIRTRTFTEVDPAGIVTPALALDQLVPSALFSTVELAKTSSPVAGVVFVATVAVPEKSFGVKTTSPLAAELSLTWKRAWRGFAESSVTAALVLLTVINGRALCSAK